MSSYVVEGPLNPLRHQGPGATATSAPHIVKPLLRVSMWVSDGGLTLKNTVPLRGKLSDYAA